MNMCTVCYLVVTNAELRFMLLAKFFEVGFVTQQNITDTLQILRMYIGVCLLNPSMIQFDILIKLNSNRLNVIFYKIL